MSTKLQFTLITSTLNSGAFLERCLLSVEGQSNAAFEHLIVDGDSDDNTLAIVERFLPRYPLRLVCSAPDTGIYQAWNRGIQQARGAWILFLGSDDFLIASDILSRVAAEIESNINIQDFQFIYGDTVGADEPDWANFKPYGWLKFMRGATEFPTSVFICSKLFREGHTFDETYRICADHKFFAEHNLFASGMYLQIPMISFQNGGISSRLSFGRLQYLERRRMLGQLHRSRPWITEWYYWLRAHKPLSRLQDLSSFDAS
jgi:glycosyltransferase involved in cell wall biosynthesis